MFKIPNANAMGKNKIYNEIKSPLYKNAFYIFMNTVVSNGLGFIFWLIVTWYYSTGEVGFASAIISSMSLIAILGTLGFSIAIIRFLPKSSDKEGMINSFFTLSGLFTILLSVIFLLGLSIWAPKLTFIFDNLTYAVIFIFFTLACMLSILLGNAFISMRRAKYILFKDALFSVLKIPLPIFLVSAGAFGIFYSWGIASIVAFMIGIGILTSRVLHGYKPRIEINKEIIRHTLTFSFANYISNIFVAAPGLIMPLMIINILSPEMAAYFYISLMMANLLSMIPQAISGSLLAEISTKEETLEENKKRAIILISVVLIPCVIIFLIMADKLLLLFGKEYSESALNLLRLLAISSIPFAINSVYVSVKNFKKEIIKVVMVNGLLAFMILISSYVLMKEMGLIGIGMGWIIGNLIVVGVILFDIKK